MLSQSRSVRMHLNACIGSLMGMLKETRMPSEISTVDAI